MTKYPSIFDMSLHDMQLQIKKHLPVRKKEKKLFGEVFTPYSVIHTMLDSLPSNVWSNPDLTWLDPANGTGHFPMIVFERLNHGLKNVSGYTNEIKRKTHIIENMLYMIELNKKNVHISKQIFGPKANIFCGSFLANKWSRAFNIHTFDIILGNPPYNENGIKHKGKKNIYVYFSVKSLQLLNHNGLLLLIHPPTYRIPFHNIQHTGINLNEIYTNKQLLHIHMYSIEHTKHLMNVMINVDWILLQNNTNNMKNHTIITDVFGHTTRSMIAPHSFIPNFGLSIMKKMKDKADSIGTIDILLSSEKHKQLIQHDSTPRTFPNIHGITSKGIKICYSNTIHSLSHKRKLIINGIGSYNYVFYDTNGSYGVTQSPVVILNPTINTLAIIRSPLFHFIANATKIIGNNFNKKSSLFLPNIPKHITSFAHDQHIFKFFGFTKNEISFINTFNIPTFKHFKLSCDGKQRIEPLYKHTKSNTRKIKSNTTRKKKNASS